LCSPGSAYSLAREAYHIVRAGGFEQFWVLLRAFIKRNTDARRGYQSWLDAHTPDRGDLERMKEAALGLARSPLFSILMPVYNVEDVWLRKAIDSVLAQVYPHWELCIADDASTKPHVKPTLQEYRERDRRIKVLYREENGHISAATNSAFSLATGDFVCLMDHDDEISPDALFEFARLLNERPDTDMVYSDEDKIDPKGNRFEPFFKPDWSPEYLETCMYTGHFACYRTGIAKKLGGFRLGYEGPQDYDFVLRFTEQTDRIGHVPKVLYHWRVIPESTASSMAAKSYVQQAAVKALGDRVARLGATGRATAHPFLPIYRIDRDIVGSPPVSIIIPSAGRTAVIRGKEIDLLPNCINNISAKSTYRNYEIVVVDNGDLTVGTIEAIECGRIHFVHFEGPFNTAAWINLGARHASGEHLLFLDDDTEVISPGWIEGMLQFSQSPEIGAVGAKLYYEDRRVQHAGISFLGNGMPHHVCSRFPGKSPGYFFILAANRNYMAVTGACMMTRRAVFEEVGPLDESFTAGYSDIDYCLKTGAARYRIVYTPYAELFHYASTSKERTPSPDEEALFAGRWGRKTARDPYYNMNLDPTPPNFEIGPG
jgi:GT2 family glycosyltransferase